MACGFVFRNRGCHRNHSCAGKFRPGWGRIMSRRCPLLDMTERFGVKIPAAQMEKYFPFSLLFSTWNGISQVLLIYSCFPFSLKNIILDVLHAKLLGGLWQEVLHGVQLWDCYRQPSLIDSAMDAWCCFWAWGSVGRAQQPQSVMQLMQRHIRW